MGLKTTKTFKGKKVRVEWLVKNAKRVSSGILKVHGLELIKTFHDGLIQYDFPLVPLSMNTISSKRASGYDHPEAPLVGKGDKRSSRRDSYAHMMRLKRIPYGWSVVVSNGLHWSGVPLRMLFEVHEYGMKIVKKDGTIINIPKRPAWRYAQLEFKRSLKEGFDEEYARMVKGWIARGSHKKKLDNFVRIDKAKNDKEGK